MTNFNGITPKAIELLSENRFNDSKAFYEEHKEELKTAGHDPHAANCAGFGGDDDTAGR